MFQSARLKLTAWYLLIIMIISISFSAVLFNGLMREVDRFEKIRIDRIAQENNVLFEKGRRMNPDRIRILFQNQELIEETKERVLLFLIALNVIIFILSGGLGYILAGRTLNPIKEMMDEQNRFISDASHELRTPLTSLKSAFEVFLRDKKPVLAEAKTIMQESIIEVNKLQALSESLLKLAQYQKPNGHTMFSSVNVSEVIDIAIHKMEKVADKKNISLVKKITKQKYEQRVYGNKESLIDLLIILVDNAIKYSPEKSQVVIAADEKNEAVTFSVSDKGIGIHKKELEHIFDRFYRAEVSRTKEKAEGYGLGLSIAKKIVENHKGEIKVTSSKEKGTVFTVTIPGSKKGS